MVRGVAARLDRIEMRRGANEQVRWLRSLTDEQLDTEIARVDARCREVLAAHGIDHAGLTTHELVPALAALGQADAASAALK